MNLGKVILRPAVGDGFRRSKKTGLNCAKIDLICLNSGQNPASSSQPAAEILKEFELMTPKIFTYLGGCY